MLSCKGCFKELLLALAMLLAMAAFFTWAMAAPGPLPLPVILAAMAVTGLGLLVVASKVHESEQGVIEAADIAEEHGGDPIAPVTRTARAGRGTALAMLSLLAVAGVLVWIFSMVGGL